MLARPAPGIPVSARASARWYSASASVRKLPIPVSHRELRSEQYSILQSSTSCIYSGLFMRGILKLLMSLFFCFCFFLKEIFRRGNLKTQPPTELNEPLRVNRNEQWPVEWEQRPHSTGTRTTESKEITAQRGQHGA